MAGNVYGPRSPLAINLEVTKSSMSACMLLNWRGRKLPPVSIFILKDALKAKEAGSWLKIGFESSVFVVFTSGVVVSKSILGTRGTRNARRIPVLLARVG